VAQWISVKFGIQPNISRSKETGGKSVAFAGSGLTVGGGYGPKGDGLLVVVSVGFVLVVVADVVVVNFVVVVVGVVVVVLVVVTVVVGVDG